MQRLLILWILSISSSAAFFQQAPFLRGQPRSLFKSLNNMRVKQTWVVMTDQVGMVKPVESIDSSKPSIPDASVWQSRYGRDPSNSPPPKSFQMCVEQAYLATAEAIAKGYKLLEVEFPPLPSKAMEDDAVGADVILTAQIEHVKQFARLFENKKVAIVFADMVERNRFIKDTSFSKPSDTSSNFRYTALGGGYKGSFIERLWVKQEFVPDVSSEDDIFVVIGASAQELPDVQKLCESAGDRPVVLFNLKLQTLRGDLGLPAFPSKDLHNSWLCKALPVYMVLPRSYTRTYARPPFLINFSGCLFRTYPGKWQVLLEVPDEENGGGQYQQIKLLDKRPALSEMREILGDELQLDSLDGDNGEGGGGGILGLNLKTLRSGVVVRTWWEADVDKTISDDWRS